MSRVDSPYLSPPARFKAKLSRSFGFSRQCNVRNIEYFWYPSMNHQLVHLFSDMPNVLVAPQYPIWVSERDIHNDVEEEQDGPDPDDPEDPNQALTPGHDILEVLQTPQDDDLAGGLPVNIPADNILDGLDDLAGGMPGDIPLDNILDDDDHGLDPNDPANWSTSTAQTRAESSAPTHLADFAVVHIWAVAAAKNCRRYCGWRVPQHTVAVLVEQKRYPSRSLSKQNLEYALQRRLEEAQFQLQNYAATLFAKYVDMQSVEVIAASGPYWSNAVLRRENIEPECWRKIYERTQYWPPGFVYKLPTWRVPIRLGTSQSDDRLDTIRKVVEKMSIMPVPLDEQ